MQEQVLSSLSFCMMNEMLSNLTINVHPETPELFCKMNNETLAPVVVKNDCTRYIIFDESIRRKGPELLKQVI